MPNVPPPPQDARVQVIVQNTPHRSNGLGTAGFVLALLGLIFFLIPILDLLLWFLGALFSFIGVFKAPRGLAIAGLVISFIAFIVLVILLGVIAALA